MHIHIWPNVIKHNHLSISKSQKPGNRFFRDVNFGKWIYDLLRNSATITPKRLTKVHFKYENHFIARLHGDRFILASLQRCFINRKSISKTLFFLANRVNAWLGCKSIFFHQLRLNM